MGRDVSEWTYAATIPGEVCISVPTVGSWKDRYSVSSKYQAYWNYVEREII